MLKILLVTIAVSAGVFSKDGMKFISGGYFKPLYGEVVKINSFLMDVYPVTNKEFLEFVKANPNWSRSKIKKIFADKNYLKLWKGDFEPGESNDLNAPVTYVSWFAAKAYAEWKGKRLPTVDEWEYAASASLTKPNVADDDENIKRIQEWYSKTSPNKISPVGSTEKNYWGIFDLFGLIWEWNYDFNTALVTGESRGDSNIERNMFCGSGSANARDVKNYPAFMRYGYRSSLKANYTVHNLGFRCAKNIE